MRSNNANEIIIQTSGGFLKDIEVIIKNVKPNSDILHPNDDLYINNQVSIWDISKVTKKYIEKN